MNRQSRETPSHLIAFRAPRDYAQLFAEISGRLGLSYSAFIRRSIEYFVATEVDPNLASALADARSNAFKA
jgi:hypothetical protein